jgi:hypothetical protein
MEGVNWKIAPEKKAKEPKPSKAEKPTKPDPQPDLL